MFFRRVQIMLMALIAVSALEQSARQSESLQAALNTKRLAKSSKAMVLSVNRQSPSITLVTKKPNRLGEVSSDISSSGISIDRRSPAK